jgi:hypothetical protein
MTATKRRAFNSASFLIWMASSPISGAEAMTAGNLIFLCNVTACDFVIG